jgi:hypothetical protein
MHCSTNHIAIQGVKMQTLDQVRFVATNFTNLQGLRNLPFSACLLGIVIWANQAHYPLHGGDYLLPAIFILVCASLYFFINQYYAMTLGRVQRTTQSRRLEWLVSSIMGCLTLAALWLDISLSTQISYLGLVFAGGILAEYIRFTWVVKGKSLRYYPVGAAIFAAISLLPIVGLPDWWKVLGFSTQLLAIAAFIGIYGIIAGILSHVSLSRILTGSGHDDTI